MNRLTAGLLLGLIAGVPAGAAIHSLYVQPDASVSPVTALVEPFHPSFPAKNNQAFSDDLIRDQQVADHITKLDGRLKKAACEGYIGGLKEQHLNVSPIINNACSGS